MIKLFVDGHIFDQEFQGSRSFVHGLYSHLSAYGDLAIYIGAHNIDLLRQQFADQSNINFVRYGSTSRIRRYGWEIPQILTRYHINLAHFQYVVPLLRPCRYIVTIHDVLFNDFPDEFPWWYRSVRNATFGPSARTANILTTDSEYSSQSISRHYGVPAKRIDIVPVGVDDKFLQPYDSTVAAEYIKLTYGVKDYILCVSRIEPRKNQALLLQSYLDLRLWEAGLSLVFIGKHSLKYNRFSQMLKSIPETASNRILHFEQVPQVDLLRFTQAARLFVYPSKCEGFGLPPLEAAALGKISLCSNTTAMTEYAFLGEYQFDPANEGAFKKLLARACRKSLANPGMIEPYTSIVKNRYSWDTIASQFHDLIVGSV